MGQAHLPQRLVGQPAALAQPDPQDPRQVADVLEDRLAVDQLAVLEDHPDAAPQVRHLLHRQGADVAAADQHLTAVR